MERLPGMLSLLLPAYNEGRWIFKNALKAAEQIASFADSYEILIIDDGSTDDTFAQAQLAAQVNPRIRCLRAERNMGKGFALRLGVQESAGEYICFCDADLDVPPRQLDRFIAIMRQTGADAVIASKMHKDSRVNYPWIRKVFSLGYYALIAVLFRLHCKDTQTGLKLFRAEVIKPVMRRVLVKRFAFDIEVLAIINARGYKIETAPIQIIFQRGNLGRLGWKAVKNMLNDTLAVFYRLYILRYYDDARHPQEGDVSHS